MAPLPQQPNGRGARSNATGRYESLVREAFDDGWTELDEPPKKLRTVLHLERARKIITTNDSPTSASTSPSTPIEVAPHGCIYCPVTHAAGAGLANVRCQPLAVA